MDGSPLSPLLSRALALQQRVLVNSSLYRQLLLEVNRAGERAWAISALTRMSLRDCRASAAALSKTYRRSVIRLVA